jgi:hypothetical protein
LALELGYASVRKMLSELNSKELSEWRAFFILKNERDNTDRRAEEAKIRAKQHNR